MSVRVGEREGAGNERDEGEGEGGGERMIFNIVF